MQERVLALEQGGSTNGVAYRIGAGKHNPRVMPENTSIKWVHKQHLLIQPLNDSFGSLIG